MRPPDEKIEYLKTQFPDRALYEVDAVAVDKDTGDDVVLTVVMTGPTRDEYRFFTNKLIAATDIKDTGDKMWAIRAAVENAALAQIRWPEREEVKRVFDSRPEMVDGFAEKLREAAGSNIELRSRKL